ncbi:MAG TPA: tRNA-dihydrouridine synthase [Solirubrobacteraceae bacterium]|nr:tRNA-dihydrouridine synthase [Solirubrobacteraceae bacterium]
MRLFEALVLGGLSIRNRVMMSPMSQRAAGEDGRARDWHLVHYGSRSVGGCGLVMVEDTAVTPLGRTGSAALGLYDQEQAEQLRRIVFFCRSQGAAVGVQLAHAGRKALADTRGARGTLAPTALAYGPEWATPREATTADLGEVVDAFVAAAALALQAGFDVVEVHAAHGYLLHQFLSPLVNQRDDSYGRDSDGRRRLLIEVVTAVRESWPSERPLFVRLPACDGASVGLQAREVVECACACAAAGATLVDLTGGTPLLGGERVSPAQTWETAAALRSGCELPMALGGGIVDGADAQGLLDEHGAVLVSVGRPLLEDPYWSVKAARELDALAPLPANYVAALQTS